MCLKTNGKKTDFKSSISNKMYKKESYFRLRLATRDGFRFKALNDEKKELK